MSVFCIRPDVFIFLAGKHNPLLKSVCLHQWSDRPGAFNAHLILLFISFQQAHSLVIQRRVNILCLIRVTVLFSSPRAACLTK